MRLPHFRLRTFMIVLAVATVECWLMVVHNGLGLLLFGPLVGVFVGHVRARDRVAAYLGGGIAGGIVATVICVILVWVFNLHRDVMIADCLFVYILWLILSYLAGFGVGLMFLSFDVAGSWLLREGRPRESPADLLASCPGKNE